VQHRTSANVEHVTLSLARQIRSRENLGVPDFVQVVVRDRRVSRVPLDRDSVADEILRKADMQWLV
jgi:hypothetical protein